MGLADDPEGARKELEEREIALKRFLQDEALLAGVRKQAAGAAGEAAVALQGWTAMLEAQAIEGGEAKTLAEEIVAMEGRLARARDALKLGYAVPGQPFVEASSVKLGVMVLSDTDEAKRKAAWEALLGIERHVLANGFLEVVKARNRLGRLQGAEDYYDWKTQRSEGMRKSEIFALLDDLEARTREPARKSLAELKRRKGAGADRPCNARFMVAGDTTNEQDPYFPFAASLGRWGRSFAALGIRYRGATMVLDLVDRKGKYENGFMHGPEPVWREDGALRPARIHFTANAIPGLVGSGKRAMETLFHEGGHAAHFANIDMPAPCFSQEFAPTSVAFAETQSMFLDSMLDDADWIERYAHTKDDAPMPFDLVEKGLRATQPYEAWSLRTRFAIPYAERAIYEIPDDELTAERVLEEIRGVERKLLFTEASPRPALSVPHLLSGESSAYYHGYIMAQMAVEQTRRFFRERDGHLADNPRIGPDRERAYWQPGNSLRFPEFIRRLTGEEVSAAALADRVNRGADEAVAEAKEAVARLADVPAHEGAVDLDAHIRVVHGREEIASTDEGFEEAAARFARWIEQR